MAWRRLVDRFGEAALACTGLDALRALLDDVSRELGFSYFALLHHRSLRGRAKPGLRLDNYPPEWVAEHIGSLDAAIDPVHLASRRTNAGFCWCELGSLITLHARHQAILERSRHYGLGDGFTVPANVPAEPSGSCSFAVGAGRELPVQRLMCTELIGAHALRAARRLWASGHPSIRPHLSRRELECLRLIAIGKSDWEIARILGIGTETVRQYVKRARAAYGVSSRIQLVVMGLRDDWLSLEDAAIL